MEYTFIVGGDIFITHSACECLLAVKSLWLCCFYFVCFTNKQIHYFHSKPFFCLFTMFWSPESTNTLVNSAVCFSWCGTLRVFLTLHHPLPSLCVQFLLISMHTQFSSDHPLNCVFLPHKGSKPLRFLFWGSVLSIAWLQTDWNYVASSSVFCSTLTSLLFSLLLSRCHVWRVVGQQWKCLMGRRESSCSIRLLSSVFCLETWNGLMQERFQRKFKILWLWSCFFCFIKCRN